MWVTRRTPYATKKVSTVSKTVYARELVLREGITVGDLFHLIDMPFQITKKTKVILKANDDCEPLLRVEWTGDDQ